MGMARRPGAHLSEPATQAGRCAALGEADGDGFPDRVECLAGSDPKSGADKPNFDITSGLRAARESGRVVLTWTPPPGAVVAGYALWSHNSLYALAFPAKPGQTHFNDTKALDSAVYKLTFFVGLDEKEGYLEDASRLESLPGWSEDSGVTPQGPPAPPRLAPASEARLTAKIALGVTLPCCLVGVVLAGTRKPT